MCLLQSFTNRIYISLYVAFYLLLLKNRSHSAQNTATELFAMKRKRDEKEMKKERQGIKNTE